jgi:hypothetical protein
MTTALAYKEFRETLPIAAVGLAALLLVALNPMGFSPIPNLLGYLQQGRIPFVSYGDPFVTQFSMAAGALALALGFWQSLGDFWGDAHLFVLHRPATRQQIYGVKLLVGFSAYLSCGVLPVLLYSLWAATPGTHASPFEWSMTSDAWFAWLSMVTLYLGAFLAGIRPAAWLGTRLAPLAAAASMLMLASAVSAFFPAASPLGGLAVVVVADIAFVIAILYVAQSRDFS